METLISTLTQVIGFLHDVGGAISSMAKPLRTVESVAGMIILAVVVAGIAANGPWKPRRRSGEHPRD